MIKTDTRWWAQDLPGRDAIGLYVVRYTYDEDDRRNVVGEHLTATGWKTHQPYEAIDPVAVVTGQDAVATAFVRSDSARQEMVFAVAEAVRPVMEAALPDAEEGFE